MATSTCPNCGVPASGKFCSECGATLGPRACPKCGAQLSARAKFCPECGTTVGSKATATTGAAAAGPVAAGGRMPWIVAGISIVALMATIIVVVTRRPAPAGGGVGTGASGAGGPFAGGNPGQATTDISNMSPREAADRLFNRVMTAAENGDSQQVQFFGPMTVQAYANVQPLDADGHMHVGTIELLLGNAASARAEADTIARTSRTHLFASLLRARAAEMTNDRAQLRQAWGQFLQNYDAERAKNLDEYRQHDVMLTQARDAARAATGR